MPFRRPAPSTLAKYGWTIEEWEAQLKAQGGMCPVCTRDFEANDLSTVIDHQHIRGWKAMAPEERKKYVRGILDISCNHYILTRFATPDKLRNAARYLDRYLKRRDG